MHKMLLTGCQVVGPLSGFPLTLAFAQNSFYFSAVFLVGKENLTVEPTACTSNMRCPWNYAERI